MTTDAEPEVMLRDGSYVPIGTYDFVSTLIARGVRVDDSGRLDICQTRTRSGAN
jgi:hypothetical protein